MISARKFDGKRYMVDDVYYTKRDVQRVVKLLRDKGHSVRAVPSPIKGFPHRVIVYYR